MLVKMGFKLTTVFVFTLTLIIPILHFLYLLHSLKVVGDFLFVNHAFYDDLVFWP